MPFDKLWNATEPSIAIRRTQDILICSPPPFSPFSFPTQQHTADSLQIAGLLTRNRPPPMTLDELSGVGSAIGGEIDIALARDIVAVLHSKLKAWDRREVLDGCAIALR
jgi:hypothetical protein